MNKIIYCECCNDIVHKYSAKGKLYHCDCTTQSKIGGIFPAYWKVKIIMDSLYRKPITASEYTELGCTKCGMKITKEIIGDAEIEYCMCTMKDANFEIYPDSWMINFEIFPDSWIMEENNKED